MCDVNIRFSILHTTQTRRKRMKKIFEWPDLDLPPINLWNAPRLKVIDSEGREYVRHFKEDENNSKRLL